MLRKNMGNLNNKQKYAPNHQILIVHVKGLGLLGGEGASLNVDGSNIEDDEDGKLTRKREYAEVWQRDIGFDNPKHIPKVETRYNKPTWLLYKSIVHHFSQKNKFHMNEFWNNFFYNLLYKCL